MPAAPPSLQALHDILYAQGFGTRRQCLGLVQAGLVEVDAECLEQNRPINAVERPRKATELIAINDPDVQLPAASGALRLRVQGLEWHCHHPAYLMLHKPAGYECSHKPSAWPGVHTLLPGPLRQRPNKNAIQGVQPVGRLDQDTTGLLLFSDDGRFIHRMASPKHHVPKVYHLTTKHPVTDAQIARLLAGVVLDDSPQPVRAAACERLAPEGQPDPTRIALTLTEGKYHQVKRMLAAVGNRVEALHRARIGDLELPPDLAPGQWRWLEADDLRKLGWAESGG